MFTGRVENSVDPDQLASEKPADLAQSGSTLFSKTDISMFTVVEKS